MNPHSFSESQTVLPPCRQDDLTFITSTIGNDSGWLVTKYLVLVLQNTAAEPTASKVVLVSWLKSFDHWRTECRRATGIDLNQLQAQGRFAFIDALSYSSPPSSASAGMAAAGPSTTSNPNPKIQVGREVITSSTRRPADSARQSDNTRKHITDPVTQFQNEIQSAVAAMTSDNAGTAQVLVILDAVDMLCGRSSESPARSLLSMTSSVRRVTGVHSTIVTASTSLAFPFAAAKQASIPDYEQDDKPKSTLEIAQQGLFVGLAHSAQRILSLRPLETGAAGDVSGVLRITDGGAAILSGLQDKQSAALAAGEWLYLVRNDGRVKIWDRKAGVG